MGTGSGIVRFLSAAATACLSLLLFVPAPSHAAPALSASPLTWDVVGLDSNDVTTGPDRFLVGARICNPGDATAQDLNVTFVWDSANPLIVLDGSATHVRGDLAAGDCLDEYFRVRVVRDPAAYDTTRRFRINVTAAGGLTASTPTPRELYVERLISQARNDAISIDGPTDVLVGQTVQYTVVASTATNGYEQLQNFFAFDTDVFDIVSIEQTYTAPPGATNDRPYADACGWDADPTSVTYRTCIGPGDYPGGRAGGDLLTVYTMRVVGEGTMTVSDLIYDFSGSSYHYNADKGAPSITITATAPADLELTKTADRTTVTLDEPVTYTLALTNQGPAAAPGVRVTDLAPSSSSIIEATPSTGSFDTATGVWSVGDLAAGATVTLTLTVHFDAAGTHTNIAEVTSSGRPDPDSTPGNGDPSEDDWSSVSIEVTPTPPTIQLRKLADTAGPLRPGDTVGYSIELLNLGPETATSVVLTDPTPAHTTYVPGSTRVDGWVEDGRVLNDVLIDDTAGPPLAVGLLIGDVAPGQAITVRYAVRVDVDAPPGSVVNTVTLSATDVPDITASTSTPLEVPPPPAPQPTDPPSSGATIPSTGLSRDPGWNGLLAATTIALGLLTLTLAQRTDRRRRLRAIHARRLANASAWDWDLPWRPN